MSAWEGRPSESVASCIRRQWRQVPERPGATAHAISHGGHRARFHNNRRLGGGSLEDSSGDTLAPWSLALSRVAYLGGHTERGSLRSRVSRPIAKQSRDPCERSRASSSAPRGHWTLPGMSTWSRAQSVPKRSGTSRLLVAHRGTKWQITGYTNRLTSPLCSSDNAEADGSTPSSPTKDLMKGHFWSREYEHLNAEVDRRGVTR
jgi:hypothetical protein